MKKVIIELDKNLTENELLMYKNGKIISIEIHELLPEILDLINKVKNQELKQEILEKKLVKLEKQVKELRGEDDEESN